MKKFSYQAISGEKKIKGIIEAVDYHTAYKTLSSQGLIILNLTEVKEFKYFSIRRNISMKDLLLFTRQLYSLVNAGIPIIQGLKSILKELKGEMAKIVENIIENISSGKSLHESFLVHRKKFGEVYLGMIKAGEDAGELNFVLKRLIALLEFERKIQNRIKEAFRYPALIISIMVVAFIILLKFSLPKFAEFYKSMNVPLPLPTKIIIFLTTFMQKYFYPLLLLIMGLIVVFRIFSQKKILRENIEKIKLKIPLIGEAILKMELSRFLRIFSTLIKSGIPLVSSLDISSRVTSLERIRKEIDRIKGMVVEGKTLTECFRNSHVFPEIVISMVSVGEESGRLDELLEQVSVYYEEEVNFVLNGILQMIEPLLLIILGLGISFVALGVFLPVWNMTQLIGR